MHAWRHVKYWTGALLATPFLPWLYLDARRVKARVPDLPEASGPSGTSGPEPGASKPIRLLAIGESTIAGVGVATHADGLTGTLAAELTRLTGAPVAWRVYAQSGYTTRRVLRQIVPRIEETEADLIVLGLGANDAFKLNTLAGWQRDIRQLLATLRSSFPEAHIVFCNMPPIRDFPAFTPLLKYTLGSLVELFGDALEELVYSHDHVCFASRPITLRDWLARPDVEAAAADFFSDGVHPSKLTYQTWGKDLAQVIWAEPAIRRALNDRS